MLFHPAPTESSRNYSQPVLDVGSVLIKDPLVPSRRIMDVESFSDEELRERLRGYNQDVPPITDTTRKILKKRLMKLMGVVASPPGKYVPKSAVPEPARTDSPLRRTRQTPVVDLRRTPSPPIAPLLRPIQPSSSASPRKILRSGAAFSSDESDSETVGSFSQQTRLRPNATGT